MGTHFKGSKKETLVLNTYIKLVRAAETVTARINSYILKKGITESQFGILDALYHIGPLCQRELGIKILKSGGNITHVIDNLEKLGFVKRERGADRRYFTVSITRQGEILMEKIFPKHVENVVKEFDVLSEEELKQLQHLCKLVGIKEKTTAKV
jgi:MarR family transcriptional regulator, 2-MHQ and catechol-resistance regulon repressor